MLPMVTSPLHSSPNRSWVRTKCVWVSLSLSHHSRYMVSKVSRTKSSSSVKTRLCIWALNFDPRKRGSSRKTNPRNKRSNQFSTCSQKNCAAIVTHHSKSSSSQAQVVMLISLSYSSPLKQQSPLLRRSYTKCWPNKQLPSIRYR